MTQTDFVFLDHAGATPVDSRVLEAMLPYFSEKFFNPSSPYSQAVFVRRDFENARHRLAIAFGGKPDEVIITAGATESIALAMTAVGTGNVVTSAIEHEAVLANIKSRDHKIVSVGIDGRVSVADIAQAIDENTTLVSIATANSELGTVQPVGEIAEIVRLERQRRSARGIKTPIWLHTDASQGVGQLDISLSRLGVDMMTLNSGKIYGPKQVGLLYCRAGINLQPIIPGGGQERNLRSGTENVAGAIGFAKALELAQEHRKSEVVRLSKLRDYLEKTLQNEFPQMVINGNQKKRLASHLHISLPGVDAERLIFLLEQEDVFVATGSACSANKHTGSSVLRAIGLDETLRNGSLRISLGRLNDTDNIKRASDVLIKVVKSEYERLRRG